MSQLRQKQREKLLLNRFIELAQLDVKIIEGREAPDFIVEQNNCPIGIEITEIFISPDTHGNTPQAQEAISSQIVTKAQRLYQAGGGPPVHVNFCFSLGICLSRVNRDKTAEKLCQYLLSLQLKSGERANWYPEDEEGKPYLPEEISFMHALGVPTIDMSHWGVARAGWVASLKTSVLQERINEKAALLPTYKQTANEIWLLVVADATRPSSSIQATEEFDASAIKSPFSRTFFFRYPESYLELVA